MKAVYFKKIICAGLAGLMLALTACGRSGYICDDRNVLIENSVTAQNAVREQAESTAQESIQPQDESIPQTVQNENGAVVSFKYSESNVENDMITFWKVYCEAGRYFIYYMNELSEESENYEISEEEYIDLMLFDFAGSLAEYEAQGGDGTEGGICYELGLSYEDGESYHTWAKIDGLTDKLNMVLDRYREPHDESSELQVKPEDNCAFVEVHYIESGGIDGRLIDRAVYKEGGRCIFAYTEGFKQEPVIFEISEKEYNEIMSLDYEKDIVKYEASSDELIYDDIYYSVRVVCANGEEISGQAKSSKVGKKFSALYKKYIGDAEIDN